MTHRPFLAEGQFSSTVMAAAMGFVNLSGIFKVEKVIIMQGVLSVSIVVEKGDDNNRVIR